MRDYLCGSQRDKADAKFEIVATYRQFRRAYDGTARQARDEFCETYNREPGALGLNHLRDKVDHIMPRTLERWCGVPPSRLIDRRGQHRLNTGRIDNDSELRDFVVAILTHQPHRSVTSIHFDIVHCGRFEKPLPSLPTLRRFIRRWKRIHDSELLALTNPDRWRSSRQAAFGNAGAHITRINQEWQIDGTPGDITLSDGRRHHILAIIDVFTRRAMFLVADSENAAAAASLIRKAILRWGVPEKIHGDNGKAFIAAHLQRFLADLGIAYQASPPFRPETKPFVESVIGTMSHDLLERLPGYSGHSVREAAEIRARRSFEERFGAAPRMLYRAALTPSELQLRLDAWAEKIYGERAHRGLDGRSPNEVAAACGGARFVEDERALDVLLREGESRRVGKDGIWVAGARYVAAELVPGERVIAIRLDDLGKLAVYDERGEFLCIAINRERAGASLKQLASIARQAQRKLVREGVKNLRAISRRIKPEIVADAAFANAVAAAPDRDFKAVRVSFHETAAIAAASKAADELVRIETPPAPHDEATLREGDRVIAELEERRRIRDLMLNDDELLELWRGVTSNRGLSERERAFLAHFEVTPEEWRRSFETTTDYEAAIRWGWIEPRNKIAG